MSRAKTKPDCSWASGSMMKSDPRLALDELERIRNKYGKLTKKDIVEESRPEGSPLHSEFTWDIQRAAYERWLDQAGKIVRSLVVTFESGDEQVSYRKYVAVSEDGPDHYETINAVMNNPDWRRQELARALADARAWRRKYNHLTELSKIFELIDKM